jgi:DNA-binding XRE family transcriptional regulator
MMDHEQIRKLRIDLGLSQAEVARATGINRTILSGFETGQLALQGDCARRLIDFFSHQGIAVEDASRSGAVTVDGTEAPRQLILGNCVVAADLPADVAQRLLAELHWVEQRIRQLEQADSALSFLGIFTEEDEAGQKALLALHARWRVLVLKLQGKDVPEPPKSKKPVTHAESVALAYLKMRNEERAKANA